MTFKFHMKPDPTPRFQNIKILVGREFMMAAITKNTQNKINSFSRMARMRSGTKLSQFLIT